jgi:hypothetical protein
MDEKLREQMEELRAGLARMARFWVGDEGGRRRLRAWGWKVRLGQARKRERQARRYARMCVAGRKHRFKGRRGG